MTNKSIRDYINLIENAQQAAEGQMPKTWNDVDPTLGKQVDKMSQAEKVRKGLAHPDTLNTEQVYKVVALDKGNALKKPTKMKVKASSLEDLFSRLSANDWYPLEINGVEVVAGKRLKQGVAEGLETTYEIRLRKDGGDKLVAKNVPKNQMRAKLQSLSKKYGIAVGEFEYFKTGELKEQGVAEEQLEETSPEAIAKISQITRR